MPVWIRLGAALMVVAALALLWTASVAEAADFTVNAIADADDANPGDGHCDIIPGAPGDQCSLRAAIREANALGGSSTITLPSGTFTLALAGRDEDAGATGDLDITADITIVGKGPRSTFVQASNNSQTSPGSVAAIDRVFDVQPGGRLTLQQLAVRNGLAVPPGATVVTGGAIRNNVGGTLTLSNVEVTDSRSVGSTSGGDGGGIANHSGGRSGGFTADSVTIVANHADGNGGGIVNSGTMTLTNVTISDNQARSGGGISDSGSGGRCCSSTLSFVTVAGNTVSTVGGVGGVEAVEVRRVKLRATLLSENEGANCSGPMESDGSNITDGEHCFSTPGIGDIVDRPEEVLGLQENGGKVRTRSPKPADVAVDGVDPASPAAAFCPATDARGLARPQDGTGTVAPRCDVGAHEVRSFTVNTPADTRDLNAGDNVCDGDAGAGVPQCSLRAAIQEANAHTEPIVVVIPAGTFALSRGGAEDDTGNNGDLDITSPHLAIVGAGADQTIVDARNLSRVFDIQPGADVQISRLRVTGGTQNSDDGGGIRVRGSLTLSDAIVDHNAATRGGGLVAVGSGGLKVNRTTVENNVAAHGGGIAAIGASLDLQNSTVDANTAFNGGGGLFFSQSTFFLSNVTVSGNSNVLQTAGGAAEGGGGILSDSSSAEVVNLTLADNHADDAGNSFGPAGLLLTGSGSIRVTLSILGPNGIRAGRRISPECAGIQGSTAPRLRSSGGNLAADLSCSTLTADLDLQNVNPLLGPLASNGGPTQTHALLLGSPAIDRVPLSAPGPICTTTGPLGQPNADQRGLPRPVDGGGGLNCDSGAFEVQTRPCDPRPPVRVATAQAGAGRVTVTVSVTTNESTPSNHLREIDFRPTTRASLDLGGRSPSRGGIAILLGSATSFTFTIIPDGPGQSNLAPFVVIDDCGTWRSFAGAGSAVTGQLGTFELDPSHETVDEGQTVPMRFAWILPAPRSWHELHILQLRISDEDGLPRFWLRWDEAANRYGLLDAAGQQEVAGGAPGTPSVLKGNGIALNLAATQTVGSGPTGPRVDLQLTFVVDQRVVGHTLRIEVAAEDDAGAREGLTSAGTLTVTSRPTTAPTRRP